MMISQEAMMLSEALNKLPIELKSLYGRAKGEWDSFFPGDSSCITVSWSINSKHLYYFGHCIT